MAKFVSLLLLALLGISMVATWLWQKKPSTIWMVKPIHFLLQGNYGPGSLKSSQCPKECTGRCGQTQYHKPCMFFCQKCCAKCLCVPPGYYGNKSVCPCYNNWKTKRGGPKCP
ncbi:hypothetical protein CRYUN_Cryun19dG0035700 [Craigia yunnanensis]